MKRRGDIKALDASKGGIPETRKNKNRETLLVVDRENKKDVSEFVEFVRLALHELLDDEIDTITITVKKRSW